MTNGTVSLGTMRLYDARPEGTAKGGVVVIQEAFGVTQHIEDVCRRLARAGWWTVAPHLFHRSGGPVLDHDDLATARTQMAELTAEGILADVDTARAHLGFPDERQAILGFCMGGSIALYVGVERALGAAVTFYGGGVSEGRLGMPPLAELAADLRTPWLGLYGADDPGIPLAHVAALRDAAGRADVPTELVVFDGAGHAFHNDERPAMYVATAAQEAWGRALGWLDAHAGAAISP